MDQEHLKMEAASSQHRTDDTRKHINNAVQLLQGIRQKQIELARLQRLRDDERKRLLSKPECKFSGCVTHSADALDKV
jgi:hypothetical protein